MVVHKLEPVAAPFDLSEHSASVERPADLGRRAWDKLQTERPLMEEDGGRREKPGWGAKKRAEDQLKWAYPFVTPDMLRGTPPSDIMAVREEVLGDLIRDEDGVVRLKIGFHPVMNRWCEFTMVRRPDLGESGQLWQVVYIYMGDPRPGHLPADLSSDIARRHYRSIIGEYALPERKDFENIRRFGARHQKLGTHMQRLERLSAPLNAKEVDSERVMDDRARDHCDYYANSEIDLANQRAGSGWRMRETWVDDKSPGATAYKADEDRFQSIQKNGYRIILKKSREDRERELRMDARDAEREARRAALQRGVRREIIEEHEHDKTLPTVTRAPGQIIRIPGKVTV